MMIFKRCLFWLIDRSHRLNFTPTDPHKNNVDTTFLKAAHCPHIISSHDLCGLKVNMDITQPINITRISQINRNNNFTNRSKISVNHKNFRESQKFPWITKFPWIIKNSVNHKKFREISVKSAHAWKNSVTHAAYF